MYESLEIMESRLDRWNKEYAEYIKKSGENKSPMALFQIFQLKREIKKRRTLIWRRFKVALWSIRRFGWSETFTPLILMAGIFGTLCEMAIDRIRNQRGY